MFNDDYSIAFGILFYDSIAGKFESSSINDVATNNSPMTFFVLLNMLYCLSINGYVNQSWSVTKSTVTYPIFLPQNNDFVE